MINIFLQEKCMLLPHHFSVRSEQALKYKLSIKRALKKNWIVDIREMIFNAVN